MGCEETAGAQVSAARELAWQAVRALVTFGFGAAAALVFRSEAMTDAAAAFGGAVATSLPAFVAYGFGVVRTLRRRSEIRLLRARIAMGMTEAGA